MGHAARFADRVAEMLERLKHRPAVCGSDREAAYRLRYEAYLRQNLLNERLEAMLYDEIYDQKSKLAHNDDLYGRRTREHGSRARYCRWRRGVARTRCVPGRIGAASARA